MSAYPLASCLLGFAALFAIEASACELAVVATADRTVEVHVEATPASCTGEGRAARARFVVGDAAALEIALSRPAGAEVSGVVLSRADGLRPTSAPTVRKLREATYFADNLAFAAPGTWTLAISLARGAREDVVTVTLPVELNSAQAAQTTANAAAVPAFSLADAYGRPVTGTMLRGKVWIASFFFASCPTTCPLMARKLAALQRQFRDAPDFRAVSVTTDPTHDTPAILRAVAKRNGAERDRWYFLTGDERAIVALANDGLHLDVAADTAAHSTRFVVVGRDGLIKGTFDSAKVEELEQLKILVAAQLAGRT